MDRILMGALQVFCLVCAMAALRAWLRGLR